ncbi:MAG: thioredoxin domain-containing protein [Candidatus Kerfeldbacteria bacterium]|nr:thioredoxin domain-containing protein [Candidatus Kerfeldbacteria bacterium]
MAIMMDEHDKKEHHPSEHSKKFCAGCSCEAGQCSCGACSMINKLPPPLAFWAGVIVTGGTIFAIGFIVLLVLMYKGVQITTADGATTTVSSAVKNSNTNTAAVANANQPKPSGKVDPASLTNVRGSGDYTVVEYSDTECPFCKRHHNTMLQVMEQYDGKLRWAYKYFPLKSLHQKAEREALAVECAAEQNKFNDYIDTIFERTTSNDGLEDAELFTMADELGLNRSQFDDCVESEKYLDKVNTEAAEAQQLGGQGTPFSVLIDKDGQVVDTISGAVPIDQLKLVLDQYIK